MRDLDKKSGTRGYATNQRRDAQYRADKWAGGGHKAHVAVARKSPAERTGDFRRA